MQEKKRDHYVEAMLEVAAAEGNLERVAEELYRFSQALNKSRDLYEALSDQRLPSERRLQIIQDLLGKKVSSTTVGFISLLVSIGRIKHLEDIAQEITARVAKNKSMEVAYVRTASELSEQDKKKLQKALNNATNKELDLKIVIDPTLLGGIVASVGDIVIDGSVKSNLQKLRETMEQK